MVTTMVLDKIRSCRSSRFDFGDTTPCTMTGVTLLRNVHYKGIQARTCNGFLLSSVKPYSHTKSMFLERPSGALPPDLGIRRPSGALLPDLRMQTLR
jgi:hypothetical protein